MIELAQVNAGSRALDVCCGTGDLAEALARAGAKVVGCDFSPEMLRVAQARHSRVEYLLCDALELPFNCEHFDVVTIGYGLRNLADLQKGISELLRVLKPNGSLIILEFGKPPNRLWRSLYFTYLRLFVPILGLIICRDAAAYSYILDSLREYPAQEGVSGILREHGCETVELYNFLGGVMSIHRAVKPASLRQSDDIALAARHFVRQ